MRGGNGPNMLSPSGSASYLKYMKRIELSLTDLRAEISIWQDSAKEAYTNKFKEKDEKK